MMNNKWTKRMLTTVLSLAVAVAGFAAIPSVAEAEDATSPREWLEVENETFQDLVAKHEAPTYDPNTEDNMGYLFAGWFDAKDGNVLSSGTGVEGNVFAKFIPAYLTGISVQTDLNYNTDGSVDSLRNMRIVSLVDSQDYKAFGFNIYGRYDADGNGTNETDWEMYKYDPENPVATQSTYAYTALKQYRSSNPTDFELIYPEQAFGETAKDFLFTTTSITDIPEDFHDATMVAQPYWVTKDGTYVEGLAEFNRINDYMKDEEGNVTIVRNVSVTLKNAKNIAAGLLDITLPSAFSALDASNVEVENGRVFEQMADYRADDKIRCIGNVSDITTSVSEDSVFVNLRFTTTTENISLGQNNFVISIPEIGGFSTNKEKPVNVSVWDVLY